MFHEFRGFKSQRFCEIRDIVPKTSQWRSVFIFPEKNISLEQIIAAAVWQTREIPVGTAGAQPIIAGIPIGGPDPRADSLSAVAYFRYGTNKRVAEVLEYDVCVMLFFFKSEVFAAIFHCGFYISHRWHAWNDHLVGQWPDYSLFTVLFHLF